MRTKTSIFRVKDIIERSGQSQRQLKDGRWVPARPYGRDTLPHRLKCAWLVFMGKADAVILEEDSK